jgi:hypothetical protein
MMALNCVIFSTREQHTETKFKGGGNRPLRFALDMKQQKYVRCSSFFSRRARTLLNILRFDDEVFSFLLLIVD